jgi:hypothetical protein
MLVVCSSVYILLSHLLSHLALLCFSTSRAEIPQSLSSTRALGKYLNRRKILAAQYFFFSSYPAPQDDVHMPHDDEMLANMKEIEKLFGTHHAIKRL